MARSGTAHNSAQPASQKSVAKPADILRVVICGAVDDGKSTLLGRLLVETGSVPKDELSKALAASATSGSQAPAGTVDYSLLVDGLESEREQGITIDVAHRHLYLPSGKRAILADSPGHEQYTRNMAVASSGAQFAILVVDATRGVRQQTLRHATVCRLMGIQQLLIAVNKLDATADPAGVFDSIRSELLQRLPAMLSGNTETETDARLAFLPISGLRGDNVTVASTSLPTGDYTTIVDAIEQAAADNSLALEALSAQSLRIPIQTVIRADTQRRVAGRIARGRVAVGDTVTIWPSETQATVTGIGSPGEHPTAVVGNSVSIELDKEVDVARGDVLYTTDEHPLPVSRAHLASLVWLSTDALNPNASYVLRVGPIAVPARVEAVRYVLDLDSGQQIAGRNLGVNDVGLVEVTCDTPILLDSYLTSHGTGGFILVDRVSGMTVAAGMSVHPLRRESDVVRHAFSVDRAHRENLNGFRSGVMWLTGLPGSGKSTIADGLEKKLFENGIRSYVLDGDTVRQTLSEDLGFSPEDRAENVRRVARTAGLMMDAGLIVIVSLVSPFRTDRELAKEMFAQTDFVEVFVDTPLEICAQRDPKGLYKKASGSQSSQMTGVGQTYEEPLHPDVHLDGTAPVEKSIDLLFNEIVKRRVRATDD